MTISFQQLRSAIPGAQPQQLDPGQVAFNVSDGTMYLGTGSDTKIDFSGAQVLPAPPAGKGWLQVLLEREALSAFFLDNPTSTGGAAPTNEQVLTWNATEGKAEWQDAGTGFSYLTTSDSVAASIGATTSEKISAAIGNPTYIGINASCIVTGDPGTLYEGLYIWDGNQWQFASHFAYNTASQVPGVNPMNLLQESTQNILNALKGVDDNLQVQITSNDGDIATLQGEMAQAQTDIINLEANKLNIASNIPQAGQILSFDGNGQLWVDDSQGDVTSVSATAPIAVDNTDPQNPILSLPSTAAGQILVGDGAGAYGPLSVGNDGDVLTVVGGTPVWSTDSPGDVTLVTGTAPIQVDNTDQQLPVVSVDLATTATPGVVQVELTGNLTLVGGVINVPDASTTVKGAVQLNNTLSSSSTAEALTAAKGKDLQDQINALTLSNSVTLAGGYDATTGFVDGVTTQGTAAGFTDGAALPDPTTVPDFYLVCVVAGSDPSPMDNGDWLLSDGTNWIVLGVGARPASASYTTAGIVQLADTTAVEQGTSDTLAITPQSLQDNVLDAVNVANSSTIASSTAVKTAYDAAIAGQNAAAAAQATANAALPKAGGTMTGTIVAQSVNVQSGFAVQFNGGVNGSVNAISDSVSTTSSTTAASATAVKAANDAAAAAQADATQALSNAATAQADATQALADAATAQTTADNAIPKAAFTAANEILVGTGASAYSPLTVGTDGQLLTVVSGSVEWADAPNPLTGYTTADNTALGSGTMDSLTTGVDNTAIGVNAATSVTSGSRNVLIGDGSGDGLTTGNNNTAVGYNTFSGTGGSNNVLMGYQAGLTMTSGNSNVVIGANAGDALTGANSVVAIGQGALSGGATAAGTVAIGETALGALTTGQFNTAVGYRAGDGVTTGGQNTLIGDRAGQNLASQSNNTFLGYRAGYVTRSENNVFIGATAGDAVDSGGSNTIIGQVTGSAALANNLIIAAGSTVKLQVNANGAVNFDGTNYGTAGQVLTSNGQGSAVSWSTPAGGLISSVTAPATGTDVVVSVPAGTQRAKVYYQGVSHTLANPLGVAFQLAVGGVPVTTGYNTGYGAGTSNAFYTNFFMTLGTNSASAQIWGQAEVNLIATNTWTLTAQTYRTVDNVLANQVSSITTADAVTDFHFESGNGTFDGGTFVVEFYA